MLLEDNHEYVIITPAYNEAEYIERTIRGVLAQSVLPCKWIIVDDGSTDNTAEIIKHCVKSCDFLEYCLRTREVGQSYYGSNVYAIHKGYQIVKDFNYKFLAILDADMELCDNYYKEIFNRFFMNPEMGIATGTYFEEVNGCLAEAKIDRRSTPKALQVFRRECFEQIGGYIPFKFGGEDSCAEIMARMHGWQTWSFPEIKAYHQKPVGTGDGRSILSGRLRQGMTDYSLGTHPLFMFLKCFRRCMVEKPFLFSALARLGGYILGYITREPRQIPEQAKRYVRKEQMKRLRVSLGFGKKLWSPVNT